MEAIPDQARAAEIRTRLEESGREVIALSAAQSANFAGNAVELSGRDGCVLALSACAAQCLTPTQQQAIEHSARLLRLAVPTSRWRVARCAA